jgi:hypothetical protein
MNDTDTMLRRECEDKHNAWAAAYPGCWSLQRFLGPIAETDMIGAITNVVGRSSRPRIVREVLAKGTQWLPTLYETTVITHADLFSDAVVRIALRTLDKAYPNGCRMRQ